MAQFCTLTVMAVRTETPDRAEQLLEQLRSRRRLPAAAERRQIREAAGVSLRELAGAIGTSHMAVDRWEKGAAPRDPAHLRAYSRLLDELRHLADA